MSYYEPLRPRRFGPAYPSAPSRHVQDHMCSNQHLLPFSFFYLKPPTFAYLLPPHLTICSKRESARNFFSRQSHRVISRSFSSNFVRAWPRCRCARRGDMRATAKVSVGQRVPGRAPPRPTGQDPARPIHSDNGQADSTTSTATGSTRAIEEN